MQDASQKDPDLADQPWRTPLEELERTLEEVGRALSALRSDLEASSSAAARPQLRVVEPDPAEGEPDDPQASVPEAAEPLAGVVEPKLGEGTSAPQEPALTEFQKVWERHKQESPESAEAPADMVDEQKQEPEEALHWSANEESSAEAEQQASKLSGFDRVWERLKQRKGIDETPEDGDVEAPATTASAAPAGAATGSDSNLDRLRERLRQEKAVDGSPEDGDVEAPSTTASDARAGAATGSDSNFDRVWERLRQEKAVDESPEDGDVEAPSATASDARAEGKTGSGSNFDHVWERLKREREGRSKKGVETASGPHGLENLPKEYRMTIEDRDGTPVDLVPLRRALMAFAPADDISLLGYAKGTAIISLRTEGELDLDRLASVIGTATARQCEVIPQDQGKLFLRLSEEEEGNG